MFEHIVVADKKSQVTRVSTVHAASSGLVINAEDTNARKRTSSIGEGTDPNGAPVKRVRRVSAHGKVEFHYGVNSLIYADGLLFDLGSSDFKDMRGASDLELDPLLSSVPRGLGMSGVYTIQVLARSIVVTGNSTFLSVDALGNTYNTPFASSYAIFVPATARVTQHHVSPAEQPGTRVESKVPAIAEFLDPAVPYVWRTLSGSVLQIAASRGEADGALLRQLAITGQYRGHTLTGYVKLALTALLMRMDGMAPGGVGLQNIAGPAQAAMVPVIDAGGILPQGPVAGAVYNARADIMTGAAGYAYAPPNTSAGVLTAMSFFYTRFPSVTGLRAGPVQMVPVAETHLIPGLEEPVVITCHGQAGPVPAGTVPTAAEVWEAFTTMAHYRGEMDLLMPALSAAMELCAGMLMGNPVAGEAVRCGMVMPGYGINATLPHTNSLGVALAMKGVAAERPAALSAFIGQTDNQLASAIHHQVYCTLHSQDKAMMRFSVTSGAVHRHALNLLGPNEHEVIVSLLGLRNGRGAYLLKFAARFRAYVYGIPYNDRTLAWFTKKAPVLQAGLPAILTLYAVAGVGGATLPLTLSDMPSPGHAAGKRVPYCGFLPLSNPRPRLNAPLLRLGGANGEVVGVTASVGPGHEIEERAMPDACLVELMGLWSVQRGPFGVVPQAVNATPINVITSDYNAPRFQNAPQPTGFDLNYVSPGYFGPMSFAVGYDYVNLQARVYDLGIGVGQRRTTYMDEGELPLRSALVCMPLPGVGVNTVIPLGARGFSDDMKLDDVSEN